MGRYVDVSEYGVFLSIDVISGEVDGDHYGEIIADFHEDMFFKSLEEAQKVAAKYRKLIGYHICSWGDDIGILHQVFVDDEPRINQYFIDD